MQIKELGEFGLIDRLTKEFPIVNKSTELSVGDDCAILDYTGKKTLVTKDLLLEGVHFDLTYCPLLHLGYKSAIVNFSDVYAMNGKPKQMVVGLGVVIYDIVPQRVERHIGSSTYRIAKKLAGYYPTCGCYI